MTTRPDPDPLWTEPTDSERLVMDTWRRAIADEEESHLGAIVVIAAVVVLSVIAAWLLLGYGREVRLR